MSKIHAAAIDLGGTKIEASLFDADFNCIKSQRIATPQGSYDAFCVELMAQLKFCMQDGGESRPIGISLPGLVNPDTGQLTAANLPVEEHPLIRDIETMLERVFIWENDCQCFAYSEAHGGAGEGAQNLIGLIIGTGLAAGHIAAGDIIPSLNHSAVEIGHMGAPARVLSAHKLPLFTCGCGREGCWEAYVSGIGVANLTREFLGKPIPMQALLAEVEAGAPAAQSVYDIWLDITAELIFTIQLSHDPESIVLGGGLSLIPDLNEALSTRLNARKFPAFKSPQIKKARFGDSSGARGAAILASQSRLAIDPSKQGT